MANPFMPSVAGSLNMAGQDTLQQLLQRRMMEEQLAARQQQMAMQQQQQMIGNLFRARADQRSEEGLRIQGENAQRMAATAQQRAERQAAEDRQRQNERGVASMVAEGMRRGASREELLPMALEGRVPASMLPREPKVEPTLADIEAQAEARARGSARGRTAVTGGPKGPKPVRPKPDDPGLPKGFRDAISGRVGTTGFESIESAEKSIRANWSKWRANYPGLDASKVRSELENIFGPRERQAGGGFLFSDDQARAAAQRRAASVPSLQR